MGGRADRLPLPLRAPARWLWRQFDPRARAVAAARRDFPGELLQPAGQTCEDRHPCLFAEMARQLAGVPEPRLLSFGCSSGEEAFTLLRYLPAARIDAIDLNARAIAAAQDRAARESCDRIVFARTGTPPATAPVYDAILCLSVLRHGDLDASRPATCTALLPFARYAAVLARLDAVLKPGGLLAMWASNFRFVDARIALDYTPQEVPGMQAEIGAFYGPDDRLLADDSNDRFLFRKRG
jgi:SAM-dependent methyltransferase